MTTTKHLSCILLLLTNPTLSLYQNKYTASNHASSTRKLGKFITNYHALTYPPHQVQEQHQRVKRSAYKDKNTNNEGSDFKAQNFVEIKFHGKDRHFHLKLAPDTKTFTKDADLGGVKTDHIYYGHLHGEQASSSVHGCIINGVFQQGQIHTQNGTYYVDHIKEHLDGKVTSPIFHSVIYHQNDIDFPRKFNQNTSNSENGNNNGYSTCGHHDDGTSKMRQPPPEWLQTPPHDEIEEAVRSKRTRRAVDTKRTTCVLRIEVDHVLFNHYGDKEEVLQMIASHVRALTEIYRTSKFELRNSGETYEGINFQVKRVIINDRDDSNSKFFNKHIGVERFLELASEGDYDSFCLAYVFTKRDFDNGVLGLAWVAQPRQSVGGICEKHRRIPGSGAKSMNTGIITIENYGNTVPSRVSHVTFAHEVGHNFGSPHDSGKACTPGETGKTVALRNEGNFIMYARATSGLKPNNRMFSPCSLSNVSAVLEVKSHCFKESDAPICGNGIVDEGEECDCGFESDCNDLGDNCCTPAGSKPPLRECKLKQSNRDGLGFVECSTSQGPCCEPNCRFKSSNKECAVEGECRFQQNCNGASFKCPEAPQKPDKNLCSSKTQVCLGGECAGSICLHYDLEPCVCQPKDPHDKDVYCHTCCKDRNDVNGTTCRSTGDDAWASKFQNVVIFLQPGSPCDNFEGYCDVYSKCRRVDADGPLRRLQKIFFNIKVYEDIRDFIRDYWWAVLLASFAIVLLMAGFIQLCSIHTPSNNPNMKPHQNFGETLARYGSMRRNNRQARGQADENRQRNNGNNAQRTNYQNRPNDFQMR